MFMTGSGSDIQVVLDSGISRRKPQELGWCQMCAIYSCFPSLNLEDDPKFSREKKKYVAESGDRGIDVLYICIYIYMQKRKIVKVNPSKSVKKP